MPCIEWWRVVSSWSFAPDEDAEKEADLFAGESLMPEGFFAIIWAGRTPLDLSDER
jgi:hypothetical protein